MNKESAQMLCVGERGVSLTVSENCVCWQRPTSTDRWWETSEADMVIAVLVTIGGVIYVDE